ncbi:MAG: hypothetical protein ACOC44_11280 [Promethearchaeia archaeon]
MKEKVQFEISKENLQRLNRISEFLKIETSQLVELAFQEFFLMVQDNTEIFLKEIGFYEKLKKQIP